MSQQRRTRLTRGRRIISVRRPTRRNSMLPPKNGDKPRLKSSAPTRRILLLAAPDTQILDLVGPFQVFARAGEIVARSKSGPPAYSLELVTTEPGPLHTCCGLRIDARRTFREVRGRVDTLL